MTRADANLEWLKEKYATGALTLSTFEACVENNLQAQREGWGQEQASYKIGAGGKFVS